MICPVCPIGAVPVCSSNFFKTDGHLNGHHPKIFAITIENAKKRTGNPSHPGPKEMDIPDCSLFTEEELGKQKKRDQEGEPEGAPAPKKVKVNQPDRKKPGPSNKYTNPLSYYMENMDPIMSLSEEEINAFKEAVSAIIDPPEVDYRNGNTDRDRYQRRRDLFDSMSPLEEKAVDIYLDRCDEEMDENEIFMVAGIYVSPNASKINYHLGPVCGSSAKLKRINFIPFGLKPCASCFSQRNMEPCAKLIERGDQPRVDFFKDKLDPTEEDLGLVRPILRLYHTDDIHKDVWNSYVHIDNLVKAVFSVEKKRGATRKRDATEARKEYTKMWREENKDLVDAAQQRYWIKHQEMINKRYRIRYYQQHDKILEQKRMARLNNLPQYLARERLNHQKHKAKRNAAAARWRKTIEGYKKRIRYQAESRGIPFALTNEEVDKFVNAPCAYCGVTGDNDESGDWEDVEDESSEEISYKSSEEDIKPSDEVFRIGVDRVNSNIEYRGDNCRSCCYRCNMMKGDLPLYDFIQRCTNVAVFTSPKYETNVEDMKINRQLIRPLLNGSSYAKHKAYIVRRHMTSELTKAEYEGIREGSCVYCGETNHQTMTVDRIDSSGNYTMTNCVSACHGCNMLKNIFLREDFETQCFVIARHMRSEFDGMDFSSCREEDMRTGGNIGRWTKPYTSIDQDDNGELFNTRALIGFDESVILSDFVFVTKASSRVYHTFHDCTKLNDAYIQIDIKSSTNRRLPCSYCRPIELLKHHDRQHELQIIKNIFNMKHY